MLESWPTETEESPVFFTKYFLESKGMLISFFESSLIVPVFYAQNKSSFLMLRPWAEKSHAI